MFRIEDLSLGSFDERIGDLPRHEQKQYSERYDGYPESFYGLPKGTVLINPCHLEEHEMVDFGEEVAKIRLEHEAVEEEAYKEDELFERKKHMNLEYVR